MAKELTDELKTEEILNASEIILRLKGEIDIFTVQTFKNKLYETIDKVAALSQNEGSGSGQAGKQVQKQDGEQRGKCMDAGICRRVAVVECGDLKYIDSTGLGAFVGALKHARQKDVELRIRNLKDGIRKLFDITSLDKIFIIE